MYSPRKLIEHLIPLAEISEALAREKAIRHGHPSTLHIWWARRPLAASRATAFAALIDDPGEGHPEEREHLQELIKQMVPWERLKNGHNAAIEEARRRIQKQYGCSPQVLDPFAGGGSISLENLRLIVKPSEGKLESDGSASQVGPWDGGLTFTLEMDVTSAEGIPQKTPCK